MATLVLFLSIVRFRIVPRRRMWERARRGDESILAQGTYRTEQRTGVLIFASVAQRYAEVIADPRINVEIKSENLGQRHFDADFSDQGRAFRRRFCLRR